MRATPSTSAKVERLRPYLASLADADLGVACTFLAGRPFPPGDGRRLGVGWAAIAQALRDLTRIPDDELGATYRAHGDLGDTAAALLARYPPALPLVPHPLTLARVASAFGVIAAAQGAASRGTKAAVLRGLLGDAAPREAAYLIKIMTSDMRVGLREGLLLSAIAAAFGRDAASVRRAALFVADPGEIAVRARAGELEHAALIPGRPFRFMLASPLDAPGDALDPGGPALWVEDKYDGIRAQVHRVGGVVRILSRTLDDVTPAFPELTDPLSSLAETYILDGEIVAWKEGRALEFFQLQQRLQRRDPGRLVEAIPVVLVAFDLLHLDGRDLETAPLAERRAALEALGPRAPVRISTGAFGRTAGGSRRPVPRGAPRRQRGHRDEALRRPLPAGPARAALDEVEAGRRHARRRGGRGGVRPRQARGRALRLHVRGARRGPARRRSGRRTAG